MFKWYLAYPIVGALFLVLDMAWLRFAGPALYRPALGDLLTEKFRIGPAVAFYVIYFAALTLFAVAPGTLLAQSNYGVAIATGMGAALGLTAYATYNLTSPITAKSSSHLRKIASAMASLPGLSTMSMRSWLSLSIIS